MELEEMRNRIKAAPAFYIYGAGVIAYGAFSALKGLFGVKAKGFLVSDRDGQTEELGGVPVLEFESAHIEEGSFIIAATPEEYHDSIEKALKGKGIRNYIKMDSSMEYNLMGQYLKKEKGLCLIEDYDDGWNPGNVCKAVIYMAVSHNDRKMRSLYHEPTWVRKIQVGAVLTEERISGITDEEYPEISKQNALYGELAATYYAWKRDRHAVTGVFHYRRVLDVSERQLGLLNQGIIDVILPLPFVCCPDASGQYGRYLLPEDVAVMLNVLGEMEPGCLGKVRGLLKQPYLYNYNILIARWEVFDSYCRWLFPRLTEIASRCEAEKRDRLPRYIGRVGEVLTSLYFMGKEKELKIVHARKVWRV